MKTSIKKAVASLGLLFVFAAVMYIKHQGPTTTYASKNTYSLRRSLAEASSAEQHIKKYKLPDQAQAWCEPSRFPPLNYYSCNPDDIVHQVPFMAGLTNGLKMMLLMVIGTFEKNRCLFVTENHNHLLMRDDKSQELETFIGRYFEPIGLALDDPIVKKARKEGRVQVLRWMDYWDDSRTRRTHGMLHNITSLGYENIESTVLKKVMLQRMWRLQPHVRDKSCTTLEGHGLEDEYMAFSVRRGDKDTEGFAFTKPDDYVKAAQEAAAEHFGGNMPKIFVATDDCSVMKELRELRPDWTFVSECDRSDEHAAGFVLADMRKWTLEQTDEHFHKFFVELLGLAGAKFYIGVAYTNVAWWAAYMRPYRWSHQFLDKATKKETMDTLNVW